MKKEKKKPNDYYYGEWAYYDLEEERKEAQTYLELWMKFFLRKLPSTLTFVEAQFIDRPPSFRSFLYPNSGFKN